MAFINEYISEDDIEKYHLKEILFKYNRTYKTRGIPSHYRFKWTVDRQRDSYLMRLRTGREEFSHESDWVLYIAGESVEIKLERCAGGSKSYREIPFVKIWGVVNIRNKTDLMSSEASIYRLLKESLSAYGDRGVNSHVDDVLVKFDF